MAIKYYTGIDLNRNELKNAQVENCLTSAYPQSPVEGQIIYDSQEHLLKVYKGCAGGWSSVGEPLTAGDYINISNGTVSLNIDGGVQVGEVLTVDGCGGITSSTIDINGHALNGSFDINGDEIPMSGDDSTSVYDSVVAACSAIGYAIDTLGGLTNDFDDHRYSTNNPHQVSADQLGDGQLGSGVTATTPAQSSNDTSIATTAYVTQKFGSVDALTYKGAIAGCSVGAYGALTVAAGKGDVYKVSASGKIDGVSVEAGDMIICNTDSTAAATSSNYSTIAANWDFIQGNLDGVVIGPASAADGRVAVFDGVTGKLLRDGGYSLSDFQPVSTAVKYGGSTAVGCGTVGVYVDACGRVVAMTHSLGCDVPSSATFSSYVNCMQGCGCGNAVAGLSHCGNTLTFTMGCFLTSCDLSDRVRYCSTACGIGDPTRPVYVDCSGHAVPMCYSIETSVPPCAVFTDTVTTIGPASGCGNVLTGLCACGGVITPTYGMDIDTGKLVTYPGCQVGGTTTPVYISSCGEATAIGYTIQTSVPSGAVFTDHITTATDSGTGNVVTGVTADANGALTVAKGSVPVVRTSTATIAASSTTASVTVEGDFLGSYVKGANGELVIVSTTVSVSNGTTTVAFTCAEAPGEALTCVVVYK